MDRVCKDIKKALPKKLDVSGIRKVRESLECSLTALQGTHSDEECFSLLKSGIMYLISEILRLWMSSDERELDDGLLSAIMDCVMVASDHGVKSSSFVASLITDVCLHIVFSDKFECLSRIEVLNKLNLIYESVDPSLKEKLLQTEFLVSNLENLFQLVLDIGDYEFQACLMEFLFRLIPQKLRLKYSTTLIRDRKTRHRFLQIRDSYFEVDCRKFLNLLNCSQDIDRRVFSYPCHSIFLGTLQLQKPSDVGYDEFWLDVNLNSKRITIFSENEQVSSQMSFEDDSWNTVHVWEADIDKCVCQEERGWLHVYLSLKPTAPCIRRQFVEGTSPVLHIVLDLRHNLKTALRRFLDKKFEQSLNGLSESREKWPLSFTSNSLKAYSPATTTASDPLEKQHKVSVPSDRMLMLTPASFVSLESYFSREVSGEHEKPPPQTRESRMKPDDSSQSTVRRSRRLKTNSSLSPCSSETSRRKTRSSSEPDGSRGQQHQEKLSPVTAATLVSSPISSEKKSLTKRKFENRGYTETSKPTREKSNKEEQKRNNDSSLKVQAVGSSKREVRSRTGSVGETCITLRNSRKRVQTSQSSDSDRTEKSTFQGKSQMPGMNGPTLPSTGSRAYNREKNVTDDEKLKVLGKEQKTSTSTRYVFRDCTDRQSSDKESAHTLKTMTTFADCEELMYEKGKSSKRQTSERQDPENQTRAKMSKENAKAKTNHAASWVPQRKEAVQQKNTNDSDVKNASHQPPQKQRWTRSTSREKGKEAVDLSPNPTDSDVKDALHRQPLSEQHLTKSATKERGKKAVTQKNIHDSGIKGASCQQALHKERRTRSTSREKGEETVPRNNTKDSDLENALLQPTLKKQGLTKPASKEQTSKAVIQQNANSDVQSASFQQTLQKQRLTRSTSRERGKEAVPQSNTSDSNIENVSYQPLKKQYVKKSSQERAKELAVRQNNANSDVEDVYQPSQKRTRSASREKGKEDVAQESNDSAVKKAPRQQLSKEQHLTKPVSKEHRKEAVTHNSKGSGIENAFGQREFQKNHPTKPDSRAQAREAVAESDSDDSDLKNASQTLKKQQLTKPVSEENAKETVLQNDTDSDDGFKNTSHQLAWKKQHLSKPSSQEHAKEAIVQSSTNSDADAKHSSHQPLKKQQLRKPVSGEQARETVPENNAINDSDVENASHQPALDKQYMTKTTPKQQARKTVSQSNTSSDSENTSKKQHLTKPDFEEARPKQSTEKLRGDKAGSLDFGKASLQKSNYSSKHLHSSGELKGAQHDAQSPVKHQDDQQRKQGVSQLASDKDLSEAAQSSPSVFGFEYDDGDGDDGENNGKDDDDDDDSDDDDDDDMTSIGLVIETDDECMSRKINSPQRLNQNPHCSESMASDKHKRSETTYMKNVGNKSAGVGVEDYRQSKTPVNIAKTAVVEGKPSSSAKRNATWKKPLSVTHRYQTDEDSEVTNPSQESSTNEHPENTPLQTTDSDSTPTNSRSLLDSINAARRLKGLDTAPQNHTNESKVKRSVDYTRSKLNKPSGKQDKSDELSVISSRRLREKLPVSYKENSESSGLESDTEERSSFEQNRSSDFPKFTRRNEPASSRHEHSFGSKWKPGKDNVERSGQRNLLGSKGKTANNDDATSSGDEDLLGSKKKPENYKQARRSDSAKKGGDNGTSGTSDVDRFSIGSLSSRVSPIKFHRDPWNWKSNYELYYSQRETSDTGTDRKPNNKEPDRKRASNVPSKKRASNVPSKKRASVEPDRKRASNIPSKKRASVEPDRKSAKVLTSTARKDTSTFSWEKLDENLNRKRKATDRKNKEAIDESCADSLYAETIATDMTSELSWIAAHKKHEKKAGTAKTYGRHDANPFSPGVEDDTLGLQILMDRSPENFRRASSVAEQSSPEFHSPVNIPSAEATPDLSRANSDKDGRASEKSKVSLNLTDDQTPRTSICGSAFSELSVISRLSYRLTSLLSDRTVTEAVSWLQAEQERSPFSNADIVGSSIGKTSPVKRPHKASKKRRAMLSDEEVEEEEEEEKEEMRGMKILGLISGPSSVVRPSTPMLKRTFEGSDSSSSDDDEKSSTSKQLCLRPRALFTDTDGSFSEFGGEQSKSKGKSLAQPRNNAVNHTSAFKEQTEVSASEASEEENAWEDAASQPETEFGGEQGNVLNTLVQGFGFDLQKHVKAQERQVQKLATAALELSSRRANQLWAADRRQWNRAVNEFKGQIKTELGTLEREVSDLDKVEKKAEIVYQEQLKLLRDKRENLKNGVKKAKNCYETLRVQSHRIQDQTRHMQREMETQMKRDMDQLKNKMLLDMQQQQRRQVKESILKHTI